MRDAPWLLFHSTIHGGGKEVLVFAFAVPCLVVVVGSQWLLPLELAAEFSQPNANECEEVVRPRSERTRRRRRSNAPETHNQTTLPFHLASTTSYMARARLGENEKGTAREEPIPLVSPNPHSRPGVPLPPPCQTTIPHHHVFITNRKLAL